MEIPRASSMLSTRHFAEDAASVPDQFIPIQ
jgi:hypothetical protein